MCHDWDSGFDGFAAVPRFNRAVKFNDFYGLTVCEEIFSADYLCHYFLWNRMNKNRKKNRRVISTDADSG